MNDRAIRRRQRWKEETLLLLVPLLCAVGALINVLLLGLGTPALLLPAVTRIALNSTLNASGSGIAPGAIPTDTLIPTPTSSATPSFTPTRTQTATPTSTRVTPSLPGNFEGFVYNLLKQSIPQAQVVLSSNQKTLTNSDGLYSFKSVPPGNYQLTLLATGYETTTQTVFIPPGQTQRQDFFLARALLKQGPKTTLTLNDCFDFETGAITKPQNAGAFVAIFFRCAPSADIWWLPNGGIIQTVNNDAIGFGKSKLSEDCSAPNNTVAKAVRASYYCVTTVGKHNVVMFIDDVDFAKGVITFDWWLYY